MKHKSCRVISLFFGLTMTSFNALSVEITLPQSSSKLREAKLAGYVLAQQKCSICHSFDYISFQPPSMNQAQWTIEVKKMRHSYGAPLTDADIISIGAYLAVAYGSAKATDGSIIAASAMPKSASNTTHSDAQSLLNANGCLGCHAIDKQIVGPSFQEIAAKYKGDAKGKAMLATSIKQGVTGKWGQMSMPPMGSLTDAEAKVLATFVLEQ